VHPPRPGIRFIAAAAGIGVLFPISAWRGGIWAADSFCSSTQHPTHHLHHRIPIMIHEVNGDILLSKAEVIAHGVAPGDHFQTGLALSLREQWPGMFKDFRHFCRVENPDAGTLWLWSGPGRRVANLFTQKPGPKEGGHPGKASLENVNHALRELRRVIEKEKIKSVALPRLATGVGGLAWSDVRPLIDRHLGDTGIPIIIYSEYHKGQAASEPLPA
jgi:O-acetyl-ADP-ribose deacetylase (regulator of RNase III)